LFSYNLAADDSDDLSTQRSVTSMSPKYTVVQFAVLKRSIIRSSHMSVLSVRILPFFSAETVSIQNST